MLSGVGALKFITRSITEFNFGAMIIPSLRGALVMVAIESAKENRTNLKPSVSLSGVDFVRVIILFQLRSCLVIFYYLFEDKIAARKPKVKTLGIYLL